MKSEDIIKVQKLRGRSSNTLKVFLRKGEPLFVPQVEENRHYRAVLAWLAEGNKILLPEPKPVDPNRGRLAFCEHPNFQFPKDQSVLVWHFMPFKYFKVLLANQKLFLTRAHFLRKEHDKKEGVLPLAVLNRDPHEILERVYGPNHRIQDVRKYAEHHRKLGESLGYHYFIHCWHLNSSGPTEEMKKKHWGVDPHKILLRSDVDRLKRCFGQYTDYNVYIGQVTYITDDDTIDEGNYFNFYLHKRTEFDHEQELRVFLCDDGDIFIIPEDEPYGPSSLEGYSDSMTKGFQVPIDLNILINKVIVSPEAGADFAQEVSALLGQYGLPPSLVSESTV